MLLKVVEVGPAENTAETIEMKINLFVPARD